MQVTIHVNGHRHAAQTNRRVGGGVNGVDSLPPPSSMSVLMGGGALWMNNVGKKLGELRDSPTYAFLDWTLSLGQPAFRSQGPRSQFDLIPLASFFPLLVPYRDANVIYFCIQLHQKSKRASVLLLDISQSFVSAWNTPTMPIGSAPPISHLLSSRRLSMPLPSSPLSPSLLDDDNNNTICIASVMTPDSKKPHLTTLMPSWLDRGTKPSNKLTMTSSNAKTRDEDEEWNW